MGAARTAWLALLLLVGLGIGILLGVQWPSSRASLECVAADVRMRELGGTWVATCGGPGAGQTLTGGAALTLGAKLDLNRASADELVLVPGIGPSLARTLVQARGGGFSSWEDVDEVKGIGPAKLHSLQQSTFLPAPAARRASD